MQDQFDDQKPSFYKRKANTGNRLDLGEGHPGSSGVFVDLARFVRPHWSSIRLLQFEYFYKTREEGERPPLSVLVEIFPSSCPDLNENQVLKAPIFLGSVLLDETLCYVPQKVLPPTRWNAQGDRPKTAKKKNFSSD